VRLSITLFSNPSQSFFLCIIHLFVHLPPFFFNFPSYPSYVLDKLPLIATAKSKEESKTRSKLLLLMSYLLHIKAVNLKRVSVSKILFISENFVFFFHLKSKIIVIGNCVRSLFIYWDCTPHDISSHTISSVTSNN
jgi:hypothetical protein